jgi:5-methylcytosine-specific restriction enzyme subunit McrC
MPKPIRVFEHEYLDIGTKGFNNYHWKALANYNAKNGSKYFTLYPEGIKFNQYVGVIQAGNLTIEILPKADRRSYDEKNKARWHHALFEMLRVCHYIKIDHPEQANLNLQHNTILEAYLSLFLSELQKLMHEGLIKKYSKQEGNQTALKGQLLFGRQVNVNLVHKERFYVRHTVYDKDHLLHQILFQALTLVRRVSNNAVIKGNAERLLLDFPDVKEIDVTPRTFNQIQQDRKTARYAQVLLISKMLLLNYRPDITGGTNNVLALLFDMNKLWEEYVYRQLVKLNPSWDISRQHVVDFWAPGKQPAKTLRPDLVIHNHEKGCMVIDTKWKMVEDDYPADDDLQQMFAYAHYVPARNLILLYPSEAKKSTKGKYIQEHVFSNPDKGTSFSVNCSLLKVPLKWDNEQFVGLDLNLDCFAELCI